MRFLLTQIMTGLALLVLLTRLASAKEPAIVGVEAQVGHGITMGGGAGNSALRASTPTLAALAEMAFRTDPWMSMLGSVFVEGGDRASIGLAVGVRVRPGQGTTRASVSAVAIMAPYSIYGISAAAGRCFGNAVAFCADIEGLAYLLGSDLPDNSVTMQLRVVVGVRFDVY